MRYKEFFKDTIFNLIVEVSDRWFEDPSNNNSLEAFASISDDMLERFYASPVIEYKLVLDLKNPDSTRLFSFKVRRLPKDSKIWHVFYVIDDYYLCPDQKYYFTDESGSYIPIVREVFTELANIFVPVNGHLTFDISPLNTEKDTSTKFLLYYLYYHEFWHNDSQPNKYYIAQEFSLPKTDNRVHLPLPGQEVSQTIKKKSKKTHLSQKLHALDLDTFLSAKDSQGVATALKATLPQTNTKKPLDPPSAQTDKQSPSANTTTDLSFLAQVKLELDHHSPPKKYIHTLIAKLSYEQLPDAQKETYLKIFPHHIQKKIADIKGSSHSETEKTTVLNKIIADYQEQVSQRLEKQRSKITTYLTTLSSPNLSIKQDIKGLVYSISTPTSFPNSFFSNVGRLTVPKGYHSLSISDKFNELTTLQLRMNNFHEIIHHDLLLLANNPFLGKIYSPFNINKSYTAEEILQLCLNTATHPDEWQLTGRKILALHLENPGNKMPTVQLFLRNATAGTGSKIDYRFPDDFINKLYCTTVSNNRLRYMLTDHVGGSLSSILGKRVTGSLILLWLYAPLLTDHSSESTIKERARFLTYLYPPDLLKYALKDIRQFDVSEVELLPSDDEYSLKYRFPLQKFKRKLSNSSFEITSIWQNIRVLICGLAYLTNPTVIQTKISNKATDLYSEIYYSAFKVLQERIVTESSKGTAIPCSLSSLLVFSAEDPIMSKIWSQWLQFFMVLIAQKNSFIKPSTLKDILKNLYHNYPHKTRGTPIRPAQVLPQPQLLPPPPSTSDSSSANDDDTLDAIALELTEVEASSSTTVSAISPSSGYEWKPVLRGIINYNKKNTVLNFGTNENYSSGNAYMSMFFINPLNDFWRTYSYTTTSKRNKNLTLVDSELLYFDLIENNISTISDQSQLESLKQAFQHGQPLTFPPLSNTEQRFNHSPLTLSPNDLLGIVLKLPTTPTPHNDNDWQITYFQLAGVNPLSVLLSERQSDNQLYHRDFQFPTLRWSRPSKDKLPTFHFGQNYAQYTNITLDEQEPVLTTPPATRSVKKQRLKPTEIEIPFKYLVSIDQGVRNPISFKIRKLPKTLGTQTLDVTTLDDTLRKASVRETLGSGFIGHATPKGSTASEPALLTAIDGIITKISSDKIDVLSRGIIENRTSTPQTADTTAASVVSFDIVASTQNLDHGKMHYKYVNQSLPQPQVLPQVSGYILRTVLDKTGKKQDNSKDNPKSKPEAWLYHLIRIQARLDDRYIDISLKNQLLAMLMDLYKFVKPSNQKHSWLKRSFIRSKVKEYLFIHQDNTFLQQFSVTTLIKWLKSNTISNLKSALDRLWLRERFARREFTRLLMKLFQHEVFESGILPPNTTVNEVLLGLEDLRSYQSKKSYKKKRDTPDPFWTALEKDFQTSTGDRKKDFFRSLWLNKAQDLDNSKATSRKNSLWSHGLLKPYFQGFFTKNNIISVNPAGTSLECMFCGEEGFRKGEVFNCTNILCERYNTPVNADSNSNPNIEVRSLQKYLEQLINNATQTSLDLETT